MSILPDVIVPNLKVVFCGSAAGTKSAQRRAYYAGPGNKFWKTLFAIRLTDRELKPQDYAEVLRFQIGLTDIAKTISGADSILRSHHFDQDRLRELLAAYRPRVLAFNGKKAATAFLNQTPAYGRQKQRVGTTSIYVLPSTSGAANGFWQPELWQKLADDLKTIA
jgi:double-stranded uracil-DNA glycosylase